MEFSANWNVMAVVRPRAHRQSNSHLLLAAITLLIAALMLLPLLYLLFRAAGVGVEAITLAYQPRTLQVLANSAGLALGVTLLSLLISMPFAWLTVRSDLPGRRIWAALGVLPLVFPSYIGAYVMVAALGPRGLVQNLLEPLGVERLPSLYGFGGALLVLTLFSYPYLLLSIRAGLRNLDPALEEASRNLGYSPLQTFLQITLPAIRPAVTAGSLLIALYVLSDFGAVSILRANTFTRAIYIQYLSSFDRSLASVLSLMLVLFTLAVLALSQRLQSYRRGSRETATSARSHTPARLGAWRWPATIFCAVVIAFSLIAPLSILLFWLGRGLLAGESLIPMFAATVNSMRVAVITAVACGVLALPVAFYANRYSTALGATALQSIYLGYGLPGIVVALSLVFFGANYASALYQSLAMLIFAYTVRFLPQALGATRSSLLRVNPRLEEASRILGVGRFATVLRITLPLLRPGIWTGIALVFLSTMKELPATLLLGPTGFTTLATQIWSAADEAFFARAAAPALLLVAVSALSVALILRQEERGER